MTDIKKYKKGKHAYKKWGSKFKEVIVMNEQGEEKKIEQKPQFQIQLDEDTAQGIYSNLATISHSGGEFIFDFIYLQPQAPKAKVRSRIITNPSHAKRFCNALIDNIKKYETQFGQINIHNEPDKKIGF